jgi:hypothetical protein
MAGRVLAVVLVLVAFAIAVPGAAAQIYELPRPDTSETQSFGVSVALDGDVAVVGASGEATCGENAGAAYVFERSEAGGVWERVARLVPEECRANAFFGEKVDVSGDRVIVSASSEFFAYEKSNAAYVYQRGDDGAWEQSAKLTRTVGKNVQEGLYAAGVAIQGDRAVVTTSGDVDGKYGGAVYVYDYDAEGDFWRRTARLTAESGVAQGVLGGTVDLDGDRIAVAASTYFARDPGSVYVFERDSASGTWSEAARIGNVREFFISLDLDGRTLLVGESRAGDEESGRVTVHREMAPGAWERVATLHPSTPYEGGAFGSTVSLKGDWALVTGYDEQLGQDFNIDRVVYAFRERDGAWEQRTIIDIGEVAFGADIDQDRDADGQQTALISSVPETEDGAAYVVKLH